MPMVQYVYHLRLRQCRFKSREFAQQSLANALLDSSGRHSTALTAPKSRVSSQGMGGVGKTMLTAAGTPPTSVCTTWQIFTVPLMRSFVCTQLSDLIP